MPRPPSIKSTTSTPTPAPSVQASTPTPAPSVPASTPTPVPAQAPTPIPGSEIVPDRQFVCVACHRAKSLREESPDAKVCSECHLARLRMREHGHYDGTGPSVPPGGPSIAEINGDDAIVLMPTEGAQPQEGQQAKGLAPVSMPASRTRVSIWDQMRLEDTHKRRLAIIQEILRLDGNIDQARSLLKAAEGQVELSEAEALLNVEGKNTEQRQASLLILLSQDELYQKLKTQKGSLEAQVQDSRRQRDALAMEFGALGDYMALCRARVAFLGSA